VVASAGGSDAGMNLLRSVIMAWRMLERDGAVEQLGLAEVLAEPAPDACAAAILRALKRPEPEHRFALDGAERTRSLVEAL
jgi:predicted glycosyltransferase